MNPDGQPLQDGDGIDISNPFGDSISILVIDRVLENQAGTYTCMADNPVGHDEFDSKLVVNGEETSRLWYQVFNTCESARFSAARDQKLWPAYTGSRGGADRQQRAVGVCHTERLSEAHHRMEERIAKNSSRVLWKNLELKLNVENIYDQRAVVEYYLSPSSVYITSWYICRYIHSHRVKMLSLSMYVLLHTVNIFSYLYSV